MNIIQFLLPPILGGIIALSTNWIAIKMLFRPHREIRLFGVRLPFTPGLIPKERSRLAMKLGEAISTHLLTPDVLANKLADPTVWPLPDCTIGEILEKWGITDPIAYLETAISTPIKKAAETLLPKAIDGLIGFPEKFPNLDHKLSEITTQIAEKSISRFAGLFVNRSKIYDNIKEAIFSYLTDPENQEAIREAVMGAIDGVLTSGTAHTEATDILSVDSNATGHNPDVPQTILSLFSTKENNVNLCERICAFHIRDGAQILFQQEPYASIVRRILEVLATYLATHMPVSDMIEQKMGALDIADTEKVILSVVGRELKLIVMLGGVFGFLIGLLSLLL